METKKSDSVFSVQISCGEPFLFADSESVANAHLMFTPPRPSCFVITGDSRAGKSLLAREAIQHVFAKEALATTWPPSARGMNGTARVASENGYLWLDNPHPKLTHCRGLLWFLTTQEFLWTDRAARKVVERPNEVVTFITGCRWEELPADLARRVKVIRLVLREEYR